MLLCARWCMWTTLPSRILTTCIVWAGSLDNAIWASHTHVSELRKGVRGKRDCDGELVCTPPPESVAYITSTPSQPPRHAHDCGFKGVV